MTITITWPEGLGEHLSETISDLLARYRVIAAEETASRPPYLVVDEDERQRLHAKSARRGAELERIEDAIAITPARSIGEAVARLLVPYRGPEHRPGPVRSTGILTSVIEDIRRLTGDTTRLPWEPDASRAERRAGGAERGGISGSVEASPAWVRRFPAARQLKPVRFAD
jgi:hypothetical protein